MKVAGKFFVHSAFAFFLIAPVIAADAPKEARVTRIIRDVKLLPSESTSRPAVVNETVREDTGVRTGDASRSELTFVDLTITRLGENSVFSFNKAGRHVELNSGSILLRVPKDSGGAGIRASAVTVAITGTTIILESTRSGRSKLIALEGGARLTLRKHPGESAYVRAGQMLDVKASATKLPAPVQIDLDQVMKTSPLITDFPPLPSQNLIADVIEEQRGSGSRGAPIYQGRVSRQPGNVSGGPPVYQDWPGRPIIGGGTTSTPPPGKGQTGVPGKGGGRPTQSGISAPPATPTPSPVILRRAPSPKKPPSTPAPIR